MENTNRGVFTLSGVTGMLIATVLLLSILVVLTIWGLKTQQNVADKPYTLENLSSVPAKANMNIADKTMNLKD